MKKIRYYLAFIFVRPRRIFFSKLALASLGVSWKIKKHEFLGWSFPNIVWWLLYKTLGVFLIWCYWKGWTYFCKSKDGFYKEKNIIAKFINWLGRTTIIERFHDVECYHCGAIEGCQDTLIEDERYFKDVETEVLYLPEGTEYYTRGTTICPKCGYEEEYEG